MILTLENFVGYVSVAYSIFFYLSILLFRGSSDKSGSGIFVFCLSLLSYPLLALISTVVIGFKMLLVFILIWVLMTLANQDIKMFTLSIFVADCIYFSVFLVNAYAIYWYTDPLFFQKFFQKV
jgi:hypothetical protein